MANHCASVRLMRTSRCIDWVRNFGKPSEYWQRPEAACSAQSDANQVPSGLLAVYKPKGLTSQDVCFKVKKILQPHTGNRRPVKVGHGGTLDPMAEGVLILGVRDGCKDMGNYLKGTKSYKATALLGYETDTLDAEGRPTLHVPSDHVTNAMILESMSQFRGDILQIPPMYSALKFKGRRMHELAREGITVDREPRAVQVFSLDLTPPLDKLPEFNLTVSSGGGFYVRSLIADLARVCGGAAHMTALVRTVQGPFALEDTLHEGDWTFDKISSAIRAHSKLAGYYDKPISTIGTVSASNES